MLPPPEEVPALLADWERFAHDEVELPLLIKTRCCTTSSRRCTRSSMATPASAGC
ncbi:MAG: hypothetical protein ACR2H2_03470 [Solirubrobacteraceae bacterium]